MENTSRYNWSVYYTDKHGDFFGTRQLLNLPERSDDLFHVVREHECFRIDLIAWKYYRDVRLWWIIAEVNNITNPLELHEGMTLRIPSYERVQMAVIE